MISSNCPYFYAAISNFLQRVEPIARAWSDAFDFKKIFVCFPCIDGYGK